MFPVHCLCGWFLQSFHLWLNVLAIALSVSGARKYLDADSALFIPALGWFDGVLGWFSSACIPVLLFANGVWMVGKDVFGGRKGQLQVGCLLVYLHHHWGSAHMYACVRVLYSSNRLLALLDFPHLLCITLHWAYVQVPRSVFWLYPASELAPRARV